MDLEAGQVRKTFQAGAAGLNDLCFHVVLSNVTLKNLLIPKDVRANRTLPSDLRGGVILHQVVAKPLLIGKPFGANGALLTDQLPDLRWQLAYFALLFVLNGLFPLHEELEPGLRVQKLPEFPHGTPLGHVDLKVLHFQTAQGT